MPGGGGDTRRKRPGSSWDSIDGSEQVTLGPSADSSSNTPDSAAEDAVDAPETQETTDSRGSGYELALKLLSASGGPRPKWQPSVDLREALCEAHVIREYRARCRRLNKLEVRVLDPDEAAYVRETWRFGGLDPSELRYERFWKAPLQTKYQALLARSKLGPLPEREHFELQRLAKHPICRRAPPLNAKVIHLPSGLWAAARSWNSFDKNRLLAERELAAKVAEWRRTRPR